LPSRSKLTHNPKLGGSVWLPQRTTKSTNRPTTEKEARLPNSTYKKLAVQCSADSFVVNQTFVLHINICGKNRQLLVAANHV